MAGCGNSISAWKRQAADHRPWWSWPASPATRAWPRGWMGWALNWPRARWRRLTWAWNGWAESVADALDAGFVLTIDYGREARDLYSPELRPRGTLTTYYRHVQTDAPLRNIGRQDITAQVDFTSLELAGRAAGLTPLGCVTQREFLLSLGLDTLRRRVTSIPLPASQGVANRAGLAALSNPGGLGRFRTLVQAKGLPNGPIAADALWGLGASPECLDLVRVLPLPLLGDRHISLPEGWPRAGEAEFEMQDLWESPFPLP